SGASIVELYEGQPRAEGGKFGEGKMNDEKVDYSKVDSDLAATSSTSDVQEYMNSKASAAGYQTTFDFADVDADVSKSVGQAYINLAEAHPEIASAIASVEFMDLDDEFSDYAGA